VKREEIDEALRQHAGTAQRVSPALLQRISESIRPTLRPVRPLPSSRILAGTSILICAAVALAGAARIGWDGFERMGLADRVVIFSMLGLLAWVATAELVCELVPGSRHRFTPPRLLALVIAALLGTLALVFRDYQTTRFVSTGLTCLATGVAHAIPAALLCLWVLRRGYAVNLVSAGLTAGAVGGLAGITLLELHCPLFEAPHVLVWHTAVVPVSAALGAVLGGVWDIVASRRDTSGS
jgi:hypothetical protein